MFSSLNHNFFIDDAKADPVDAHIGRGFYEGKLRACEYFMRYELPKPLALASVLEQADRTTLDMPEDCF